MTFEKVWFEKAELYLEYLRVFGRKPRRRSEIKTEASLANWYYKNLLKLKYSQIPSNREYYFKQIVETANKVESK